MADLRPDPRSESLARGLRLASRGMAAAVAALGVAVLAGWALEIAFLKSVSPSLISMKPNTAIGLLALGLALAIGRAGSGRLRLAATFLSVLPAVLGAATLVEYALDRDLGIDQLLFSEPSGAVLTTHPGRMSFLVCASFVLLGVAAPLTLGRDRPLRIARWMGVAAFGLAVLAVTGYAMGVTEWYQVAFPTPISLHAAAGLLLASAAVLLARSDAGLPVLLVQGGPGGFLARRLMPFALVLPLGLDLFMDQVLRLSLSSTIETALHAVALTAALAMLVGGLASRLERSDQAQRRILADLLASEGRYRALFQNMAAGFAYHRIVFEDGVPTDAILLDANAAFARQAGVDPGAVLGRGILEAIPGFKEVAQSFFERYLEVARTGAPVQFEQLSPPTGRWYGISAYCPEPGHLATVFQDITESKRRENEASQHLEVLRHLGNDVLLLLSLDGAIVQANDRACEVYGYSEDELLRLNVRDLRAPDTVTDVPVRIQQATEAGEARFQTVQRRRDGSTFPVEVSTRTLELGGKSFFQSIVRDLTAERAGRAAVDYQAMLLENLHDAVIGMDTELRITAWNRAAERAFGWTRAEVLDRRLPEIAASDAPGASALHEAIAATGTSGSSRFELRARRRDGAWVDLDATLVPLRGERGAVQGYVAVSRDVSERKRAEAELRRTQETLLHSQKMDAVGRLASGIAHDFNNLLAVIQSCSRSLRDALPQGETREDAEEIWQAGDRGAQLVRKLLAFGRKSPTSPVPTDVCAVIREFEKLMRRTVGEDVSITLSLAHRPWLTRIDPRDLEQALMNLVVNAREAMPAGGEIRIRAATEELSAPPPGCDGLAPGPYVHVTVADTGNGIAPSLLPRIFEPFFTTKHGSGAGLGLATVRSIVHGAGGAITVGSEPGRGATFEIYLPACDAAADERAPERAPSPAPHTTSRALVVEDDAAVRRATRRMLERGGIEVVEAANAVEALRLLRDEGAGMDVVVSDVVMPDVQGTDLAMVLAELHPSLPVVLVSGYAGNEDALARRVLSKPFSQEELFDRIHEALGAGRRAAGAPAPAGEERLDGVR
jgi:two-component system, cell cycle sensor histidine kinase and response regulator CckA